ncbi:MAG: DNA polymerase III subunit [Clostridia bacterium]|nr:DNA polymerase III subunit [Clostridia bacterium]
MREYLTAIAGNIALRHRLGKELEDGSVSHAYILEGPAGCGKSTLALEMVSALACEQRTAGGSALPCGSCPTCQKIADGNCPDVIHIRREAGKATMGVDTVRALRSDVITVPNDLSFKVYIVHDAHTMTHQAQNALLLTLEEPPAFVLFLLLCEDAGALLETIRSRAPILRMQPVTEEEIKGYLLSPARERLLLNAASALRESTPDDFAALIRMSNGCIGTAIELLDEAKRAPMLENRHTVSEICRLLALRTRPDELLSTLLSFGTKRDEVTEKLRLLTVALRDLLLVSYREDTSLLFFTDGQVAADLSARFTARRLLAYADAVDETLTALAANGNVRLLLMQLHIRLTQ